MGRRLKELRGSESLNAVGRGAGVVPIDVSRFEQGKRVPTAGTLKKLAAYFGVSYAELRKIQLSDIYADPEELAIVLEWARETDGKVENPVC